ncbi:MAG: hypothetical protein JNM31_09790 [Flavobacteriales bacterium]|nr:hypothetical protein [Flavobacteriales bacterium]
MSRTILIPTDLTVGSLNTLKLSLTDSGPERVGVVLMHARLLGSSITDLLFHDPARELQAHIRPEFGDALAILRNRFEDRLTRLDLALFHGRTTSAFVQFAKAKKVDEVHVPHGYDLRLHGQAIDPIPLIRRSGLPVVEVGWAPNPAAMGINELQMLFAS